MKKLIHSRATLLSLLAFIFCFAFNSFGQIPNPTATPKPQTSDEGQIKDVKVFEVRLPVTVKDKKGELIKDLTQSDFIVLEDKVRQKLTSFSDEKNNPAVYVGVLMDTSPSTAGKSEFSKRAAKDFIYSVTRLRKDKAAFMTFDHEVNLWQDFTDQLDKLDKAVDQIKKVGTQTALYDAIYQFCDEKMRSAKGRHVVVVITDGDDTFSSATLKDAIEIAQRTETTIFAISTKAGFLGSVPGVEAGTVKDAGDKDLVKMCEATGGEAFFTGDMLALEKSFTKISQEIRSQYILTYSPENQNYDGKERIVEVQLVNKQKGWTINTKKSYKAVNDSVKK